MATGTSYLPVRDDDLGHWLDNFAAVAAANQATLALTSSDLENISDAASNFGDGLSTVAAAKSAAKTATMNKDTYRKTAEMVVRAIVKRIQAMPAITPTLKLQLGITVASGEHKPLPVFTPTNAVAKIAAGGIVSLTWNANGNASGAVYTIEGSSSLTGEWTFVNAQTASRFLTDNSGTGAPLCYRIKASRGTRVSEYSNIAVVGGS